MIFLIGAFTMLHVIFYFSLTFHWKRIHKPTPHGSQLSFSIVIPVRNESNNIQRILSCIESQTYPKELFEVIIVDDFSEDDTAIKVQKLAEKSDVTIRTIQLVNQENQGKKHALTEGVRQSKFDLIITSDADCWMGENWLKSYNDMFDDTINMITGPVSIVGKGLFGRLQQVEFAGLLGFGAVTLQKESPSMCSGANLAFRKEAFDEVGGYTNNLFVPSGDDEFLLFNIMRRFPHSAKFLKTEEAVVYTSAHSSLSSFINQRTRWTSKWKYNRNWKVRFGAVLFFFDYLFFFLAVILGVVGNLNGYLLLGVLLLRNISLIAFISPINKFLKGKSSFIPLVIFQIIYPMHVLFMGMNSIFGTYTWKGRKY